MQDSLEKGRVTDAAVTALKEDHQNELDLGDFWESAGEPLQRWITSHEFLRACQTVSGENRENPALAKNATRLARYFERYLKNSAENELSKNDIATAHLAKGFITNAYLDGNLDGLSSQQGLSVAFMASVLAKIEGKRSRDLTEEGSEELKEKRKFIAFVNAVSGFEESEYERYLEDQGGMYAYLEEREVKKIRARFSRSVRLIARYPERFSMLYLVKDHLILEDAFQGGRGGDRQEKENYCIQHPSSLENSTDQEERISSAMLYSFGGMMGDPSDKSTHYHFFPNKIPFAIITDRFLREQREKK